MLENIEINCHSSIRIEENKIIYIDPYQIENNNNDADMIFITHGHYDHFSEEDIRKVKNKDTVIILTEDVHTKALKLGFNALDVYVVKPNEKYKIKNIEFETVPSYNTKKSFHPKENGWIGYIIKIDKVVYYIAGDTDITEDNKKVKCDVAFVPVRRNLYNGFQRSCKINK